MGFFRKKEKVLAKAMSMNKLQECYENTENSLKYACNTGDIKRVKSAMKNHRKFEYALLYKQFDKSRRK